MQRKFLILLLFLVVAPIVGHASEANSATVTESSVIWTQWDADHYALVDDGEAIWIGTGSGLIRWDKAMATYTRISTVEGLPHRRVFAAAVDGEGNRWFGGDGGLSRLAKDGAWRHYGTSNSGIFSNGVEDIALTADGSVWLGHTDSPYISRLRPDGSWQLYANRQTAVAVEYEVVRQTVANNALWAAAGDEVWVDYDVFDGWSWQKRDPEHTYGPPMAVASDSRNRVWALAGDRVFQWDGQQWLTYSLLIDGPNQAYQKIYTLVVDDNDGIWVGGRGGYGQLPEKPGDFSFEHNPAVPLPVISLLPTAEGMWGIGPSWLLTAGGETKLFHEVPYLTEVREVTADREGTVWLHSHYYASGALQLLDDKGTATMRDDLGTIVSWPEIITAIEPAANGDLWIGWAWYFKSINAGWPTHYHNYQEIAYEPPLSNGFIEDVFVEDTRHTWFAYSVLDYAENTVEKGIWWLDDGGTPADFADDGWMMYDMNTPGEDPVVAVTTDGRLWYGDTSGLYLYGENGWHQVSSAGVQGLVPAANGVLYVDEGWRVLILERDGRQSTTSYEDVIKRDLRRVQTSSRRNQMWTVAPDGAVWYWQSKYRRELARRDRQGLQVFDAPTVADYIEVDKNSHVWLADGALWRMSPEPDFTIAVGPASWLLPADGSRTGRIEIISSEGYQEMVDLTVSDLPPGVTAAITPESAATGGSAVLTLSAADVPSGETTINISGTSGKLYRERSVKLSIVDRVTDNFLPLITR